MMAASGRGSAANGPRTAGLEGKMIKRIYIDNVRCFTNFEWSPEKVSVLLGENGGGKTSVFEVLAAVQGLITGTMGTREAFPDSSRTRWDSRPEQSFEFDVEGNGGLYRYQLLIEHDLKEPGQNRIAKETLQFNGQMLVKYTRGDLQLYRDKGSAGPVLHTKWTRSGVSLVEPGRDNQLLTWFKEWLWNLWILRPDPRSMETRVEPMGTEEAGWLKADCSNFSSWYLSTLAKKPGSMFKAVKDISNVLPGFVELFERGGKLHGRFETDGQDYTVRFDEISDGQRALIVLYTLMHTVAGPNHVLMIDEPDNYVALRELQPWLLAISDRALSSKGPQICLISHSPEVLNLMATDHGWNVYRRAGGPTRIDQFQPSDGLEAAETIARGWEQDDEEG